MHQKFLKPYNPRETEQRIYELWEKSGFFNPDNLPSRHKKPFAIIMPPPNSNGSLHSGHALFVAVEDLMIRYRRMRGFKALWLPGADHAGFETQVVYEKKLEKEGRSRFKMEPQKLYDEIMEFTLSHKSFMENQLRSLGASCDWSRKRFSLGPKIIETVYATFQKLSEDGLLYRGKRIVNWCVKHQTAFSELETVARERTDPLYYIKYGPFTVATVRPETMFGDTAIAVNPKDKRYKNYVGKEIEVDMLVKKVKLKVIADDFVEMDFGTGAVKITPAHDPNDFEMGQRHNLSIIEAINQYGKLTGECGKYAGLNVSDARRAVVEDLKDAGLIEKIDENYKHAVKICYKCKRIIEPRPLDQWFIKTKPLAEKAIQAIKNGEVKFVTKKYEKISLNWLENIYDWNISRQIVWGMPIPAKICLKCGAGVVDLEDKIKKCPKCGGEVAPDPDTFDTWFSSGQWPFATLDFPDGNDFKKFYPTDIMETGADILFFWVGRMIMLGLYRAGKVPFKTVYLHGMVRDAQGKKMSKSKGNVVNPLELTAKFGTDALRMSLIVGNTPGTDMNLSENKVGAYKKFANKLWNISRFVLENTTNLGEIDLNNERLNEMSRSNSALKNLQNLISDITNDLENYNLYLAGEKLYHYVWHDFADIIVEESKKTIAELDTQLLLLEILQNILKILHPFMPFITEEIWSEMPIKNKKLLMVEEWPHSVKSP